MCPYDRFEIALLTGRMIIGKSTVKLFYSLSVRNLHRCCFGALQPAPLGMYNGCHARSVNHLPIQGGAVKSPEPRKGNARSGAKRSHIYNCAVCTLVEGVPASDNVRVRAESAQAARSPLLAGALIATLHSTNPRPNMVAVPILTAHGSQKVTLATASKAGISIRDNRRLECLLNASTWLEELRIELSVPLEGRTCCQPRSMLRQLDARPVHTECP